MNFKKPKRNRLQKVAERKQRTIEAQKGEGLYVFRNITKGDLSLLKPDCDGKRGVCPNGEFRGDSYFLQHVRDHEATIVECIRTPEQERSEKMNQQLILDQPDRVTTKGKVEQVVMPTIKPLNEVPQQDNPAEVLINEDPLEGVQIIME